MTTSNAAASQGPNLELLARTTESLRDAHIDYGIYSGFHAQLLGGHRVSKDVDIWVDEERYADLRDIFPNASVQEHCSPDEGLLPGVVEGFSLTLEDGTVSVMGAMVMRHQGTVHPANFAAIREHVAWCDFGIVADFFVDPVDTLISKAITQRGRDQGKYDIDDIQAIAAAVDINVGYLMKRVQETRSSPKVIPLLRKLNIITSEDSAYKSLTGE